MNKENGIFGLSVALATAFDEDGEINYQKTVVHARESLKNGCDSVTLLGTTAEATSVSEDERQRLLQGLAGADITGGQLVTGIFATDVATAVAQIRQSIEFGSSRVLVAPSYYFKPVSDEGIIGWYSKVFEAVGSDLPVCLLYNIPSQTGVVINSDIVTALRKRFGSRIGGVKDSSGDAASTADLLKHHKDLTILVGDERQLATAMNSGGQGSICGVANIFPERMKNIIETSDNDATIVSLVDELCLHPIIPALKYAIALRLKDQSWQNVRLPLVKLTENQKNSIKSWFERNAH